MALSDHETAQLSDWQKKILGLLTYMSGIDGRDVTLLQVATWSELLIKHQALNFEDCMAAIRRHYSNEPRRMWPSDLIAGVKAIQVDRTKRKPIEAGRKGVPMPDHIRKQIKSLGRTP